MEKSRNIYPACYAQKTNESTQTNQCDKENRDPKETIEVSSDSETDGENNNDDSNGNISDDNESDDVPGKLLRINEPIAQNTGLRWIISGSTPKNREIITTALPSIIEVEDALLKFFETEKCEVEQTTTEEDNITENHFIQNVKRESDGKYTVSMPFKNNQSEPILGDSRRVAIATFMQLEKRFAQNTTLKTEYQKFINEYIELGHETNKKSEGVIHYLPHHAVFKQSTTTKLRVVFNASQKTSNGKSLNDQLANGKTQQRDIIALLIQWRFGKIAATADIEKMYRQIWISPNQRNLQRIIWRDSEKKPLSSYRLKTITYGTENAPYLAIRTLQKLSNDYEHEYPRIANIILKKFYVDDCLISANSNEEIFKIFQNLRQVMKAGGFNLRKWATNCDELLQTIPVNDREKFSDENKIKTLGLTWDTKHDELEINVTTSDNKIIKTNRELLSQIAALYDPLGWLAPYVIKAKILMLEIWLLKKNWDDELPQEIINVWTKIRDELNEIKTVRIPRWVRVTTSTKNELIL